MPDTRSVAHDYRPVILLTGFGPFPGVPVNASNELVRSLARRSRTALPDFRIVSSILPTEWIAAPRRVERLHKRHRPVLALHFGVAEGATAFRFETRATNSCRNAPDASGRMPSSETLDRNAPAMQLASIENDDIARRLDKLGHRASMSDDAGAYICNAVFFRSLAVATSCGCNVGFIHIPRDFSAAGLTLTDAVGGALEIVKCALTPSPPPQI